MKKLIISVFILGSLFISSAPIAEAKVSYYGPHAICRDGTYSYSVNRRGTCSWHGGVRVWLR